MVKNLIFNDNLLTDKDKNIINKYLNADLDSKGFEYYSLSSEESIKYCFEYRELRLKSLNEYIESKDYVLIESLKDFYQVIEKVNTYELW